MLVSNLCLCQRFISFASTHSIKSNYLQSNGIYKQLNLFPISCIRTYSESEKDCSVCHARNSQLSEALCAQNEARNQHDTFHNILDRSHDPFSVVAEYFGRELFNNILIVDEPDNNEVSHSLGRFVITLKNPEMFQINQNTIQPVKHTIPTKEYGAGAEAKLRLQEGNKSGSV